jgi:hypothetical protein
MEQMGTKTFMTLLGTLSVAYGETISTERAEIYYECLKDIPSDLLREGAFSLLKSRKYPNFPTIAEIRERCIGSEEDIEAGALVAWQAALTRYHGNGDKLLNDAIVLAFGSWDGFDATYRENEVSDRAHFIRCYKSIAGKRMAERMLLKGEDATLLTGGGK